MPRLASLSLDLLQTFLAIVRNEGDAAKTAGELKINQPSMSKRLRYLQLTSTVLKNPWLFRDGKVWALTDEGRKVLPAVEEIVDRYEQLTKFLGAPEPGLKFACGRWSATGFVQQAIRLFRRDRQNQNIRLRVSTLRGAARIEGVANGSLDLATVTHDNAEILRLARRKLHIEVIASDRLALVCKEKSPWADALEKLPKTKVPISALTRFPLILPEPDAGARQELDQRLREAGLLSKLDIRLEIGGWNAICTYASDGLGVGVLTESVIPRSAPLVVRHLDHTLLKTIDTKIICRPLFDAADELDLSHAARAFREALKEAAVKRSD